MVSYTGLMSFHPEKEGERERERIPTQSVKKHARTHRHFVISQREPKKVKNKVREEDKRTVRLMKTKIIEKTV